MDNTYSAQWIKRKAIVFCAAAIAAVTCLIVFNAETAHADSLKYKIVTKTELTARQKADVKAKSVAVFAVNKKITANKLISKSWYRFKYKGKYAYIPKKGTKLRLTIKKYSKPLKVKTTYDVNVRTSYKVDSDKVTLLKKGKTISARGLYKVKANDKWYSFKLNKKTVYVCAKYTVKVKKPRPRHKTARRQAQTIRLRITTRPAPMSVQPRHTSSSWLPRAFRRVIIPNSLICTSCIRNGYSRQRWHHINGAR